MIFCDDITVAELENTCHTIHKYIPFDKYAVFCFSAREDDNEFTEEDKYFYVQEMCIRDRLIPLLIKKWGCTIAPFFN